MVALTVVFSVVIIVLLYKNVVKGKLGRWMLIFVMAGGLGNGIDRTIHGYVVDMFHFDFKIFGYDFPVFNVADIFITLAGIVFCFWLVFHKEEPKEEKAPVSRASRPMPQATERPQKGPDYLTQLQKPVVQAKVNLENEELARQQAAEMRAAQQRSAQRGNRYSKGEVFDWNMPEFSENTASDERAQVQEKSPAASSDPATYDPFAEFMTPRNLQNPKPAESRRGAERASAPAASRQVAAPRREAPAPAAPRRTEAPAPAPAIKRQAPPAAAPAPAAPAEKKSQGEFSLEDILAEFKD